MRTLMQKYLRIERKPMFVTVIHRIHDPEGFQAAEAKALEAGLPSGVALPSAWPFPSAVRVFLITLPLPTSPALH